jgi:Mn2+/Fe2+ NRAMP family transporter
VVFLLVVANVGTTCAEVAGVAVAFELVRIPRYAGVPAAAIAVSALVLRGGSGGSSTCFGLSTLFATSLHRGFTAPDWAAAQRPRRAPALTRTRC